MSVLGALAPGSVGHRNADHRPDGYDIEGYRFKALEDITSY